MTDVSDPCSASSAGSAPARRQLRDRGAASGMYIANYYYFDGMAGSLVLGQVFDGLGWPAVVAAITLSFAAAAVLIHGIRLA